MDVRCTHFFTAGYYSWTESFWFTGLNQLSDGIKPAVNLANARAALLGFGAQLNEVRLTTDLSTRQVLYVEEGTFSSVSKFDNSQPGITTSDEPYSAIIVECQSTDNYTKIVYLSGYPDGVITVGGEIPLNVGIGPAWLALFQKWGRVLKANGAGWRSKIKAGGQGGSAAIIGVQVNALPPGEVGVLVGPNFQAVPPGTLVQISGANRILGRAAHQLNDNWYISSVVPATTPVAGTIYYLRGSQGVDISQLTKYGTLALIAYQVRAVDTVETNSVTHRKRGVRTARPLGRSKIR